MKWRESRDLKEFFGQDKEDMMFEFSKSGLLNPITGCCNGQAFRMLDECLRNPLLWEIEHAGERDTDFGIQCNTSSRIIESEWLKSTERLLQSELKLAKR
jgi:hypothetical protein